MKIAVQIGVTDHTADPGRVAQEAEARGFEGLFFPEHTHMPVDCAPTPYTSAAHLFIPARRFLSPFVSMAWAASTTKSLTVGTCVGLAVQHDPIVLAKALASLDLMTGGRVVYGFGFGWQAEEMADHGVDPKRRLAITREKMMAVKALWTEEQPSFSGEYVNFPRCWFGPQPPAGRLPILLGAGGSDRVFDQVIEYCDGWVPPIHEDIVANIGRLRARTEAAGRDPATIQINVIAGKWTLETLENLRAAGVQRAILPLPYSGLDDVLPALDRFMDAVMVFHDGAG